MPNNDSRSQTSLLKDVLFITPLSLIGRAGALLVSVALANWFGDTAEMDFIYYYWVIAAFLIELLSAASAYSVFVPLLAEARAKGEAEAQRCVQSILSRYVTLMPWFCCLLVAISWGISQLFLPNVGLTTSAAISIVCGFLIFTVIASVRWMLRAILDTYQVFHLPVIVQGLRAVIVIGTIFLCKPYMSWFSIPLALIIGELFQTIILFQRSSVVLKIPLRDLFRVAPSHSDTDRFPYSKQFLRQCLLMMGAAISDGLNPVVDRGMASSLGTSSVSKLYYALRLCAIPESFTGGSFPSCFHIGQKFLHQIMGNSCSRVSGEVL